MHGRINRKLFEATAEIAPASIEVSCELAYKSFLSNLS